MRRKRNAHVWEQIMQRRIKRLTTENKHIARGALPRPESYFDLSERFSTTTQATGQLTLQDLQRLITTMKDEMRAGEQQAIRERLYRPEILPTSWRMPMIGGGL